MSSINIRQCLRLVGYNNAKGIWSQILQRSDKSWSLGSEKKYQGEQTEQKFHLHHGNNTRPAPWTKLKIIIMFKIIKPVASKSVDF